jgi:hypothetical protein
VTAAAVGVVLEAPAPPAAAASLPAGSKRRAEGGAAPASAPPPLAEEDLRRLQPLRCGHCGATAGGVLDGVLAIFAGCLPGEG